jgi:pimeloyl-ACP methyl ester carboxylesterase
MMQRPTVSRSQFCGRWTQVHGLTLHAWTSAGASPPSGDLPPVVLVHGLGMSSRYMLPLAEHLGSTFTVHVLDLPGSGRSDRPRTPLSVQELADVVAEWTNLSGLGRAAFVGNSLGCEILVDLALHHPARVASLVLQGPTADPKYLSPVQHIGRFFLTGLFERWSLGWVAMADYLNFGMRRFNWTFHDMVANRIEHKLPRVTAPTLIVWGTRDYLVPRHSVERVAELLPRAELVVIPGAAHGMNYSHPGPLASAIIRFLSSYQARRGGSASNT